MEERSFGQWVGWKLELEVPGRKEICLAGPEGAIRCDRSLSVQ